MYRVKYLAIEVDSEGFQVNNIRHDKEFKTLKECSIELKKIANKHTVKISSHFKYSIHEFLMTGNSD